MKEKRCRECRYMGWTSFVGYTCDYILIVGRSRTAGMTRQQKKEPCRCFKQGEKIRRREGIAYSSKGKVTYDQQKIRRLYFEGLNDAEIAKQVGCSDSCVYQWRKKRALAANVPAGGQRKRGEEDGKRERVHVVREKDPVDPGAGRQADPH